ncbi:type IV conjugative transfer system coupling protein TraD [Testudinibacter sp. TR-2022]|uniref:type IV conjugative transfer system coupling protein TraD n=1 Tax=Testudinibacter sp. TR-2022 TaxID=2585029 RepID=UPI00111942F5|nr:type IV conjugative transfer system coupling protein TraD [Testudinibacter sp. TR-2022]TNH04053.1 type IV conjugative transfer system coupling protein TraD [Pasteurellaceae bacterium Phil31]TNH10162.1 type IV conjugative transfer system coupling protein TraD [Testudinibacter sp. TR-2022]TNH13022.1 type IV conjugative transfer system coupling protein TraD [Testudinibacter sp. TR-2022]
MSLNTKNMTQGGQVIKYMISMFMQITNIVVYWALIISASSFFAYLFLSMKWVYIKHAFLYIYIKYIYAGLMIKMPSNQVDLSKIYQFNWTDSKGQVFTLSRTYQEILTDNYFIQCFLLLKKNALYGWGIASFAFLFIVLAVFAYLGRQGKKQRNNDQIGGRYLADSVSEVNQLLRKAGTLSHLKIGDLHIVKNSEIQNIGLHGTVGTGKSTVINGFLAQVRKDNKRAVVYDKGNNFIPLFYREDKDVILNPMDARCPRWDLWEECRDRMDLENFANPLLPESKNGDPFWTLSARSLFVSTAEIMRSDPKRSIKKLLNNLLSISLEHLHAYIKDTDAANLVEGSIEKTAMTIRGVLSAYARSLRLCEGLDEQPGRKFSIREWIHTGGDSWIFLSSDGRLHESIKPLITAWLNVAMQNVLSLKPNLDRRIWTILDELNSLHKLPLILEYLSEARKFGGVTLVGLQSFSQLENNYETKAARAIWDLLNTTAYFRAPSGEVSEWVQNELGEIRHMKFRDQYSYGVDTIRDGVNFSKEETREKIVSYSDIQNLNDLECFVSLLGDCPVVKVKLKRKEYPVIAEGKIERDLAAILDPTLEKKLSDADGRTDAFISSIFGGGMEPNLKISATTENIITNDNLVVDTDTGEILSEYQHVDKYTESNINVHRNRNHELEI